MTKSYSWTFDTKQLQGVNQNVISHVIRRMFYFQTAPLASILDLSSRYLSTSRWCTLLERKCPPRTDRTWPHWKILGERYLLCVPYACIAPLLKCLGCRNLSTSEHPTEGSVVSLGASPEDRMMLQCFPWQTQASTTSVIGLNSCSKFLRRIIRSYALGYDHFGRVIQDISAPSLDALEA